MAGKQVDVRECPSLIGRPLVGLQGGLEKREEAALVEGDWGIGQVDWCQSSRYLERGLSVRKYHQINHQIPETTAGENCDTNPLSR